MIEQWSTPSTIGRPEKRSDVGTIQAYSHSLKGLIYFLTRSAQEGSSMCAKCAELDQKIEICRTLASQSEGELMREGMAMLINDYTAEKVELHPHPDASIGGNENAGMRLSGHR